MKNNKPFEAAGLAAIVLFFAGTFVVCLNLFQQMMHFILSLQPTGITH